MRENQVFLFYTRPHAQRPWRGWVWDRKYVCLHLSNNILLIGCCTEKTVMSFCRKLTGKERKLTSKYTSWRLNERLLPGPPVGKGWVNKYTTPIVKAGFLGACPCLLSPSFPSEIRHAAENRQMSPPATERYCDSQGSSFSNTEKTELKKRQESQEEELDIATHPSFQPYTTSLSTSALSLSVKNLVMSGNVPGGEGVRAGASQKISGLV